MAPHPTRSRARSRPADERAAVGQSPFPTGTIRTTKILTDTEVAYILARMAEMFSPEWRVVIMRDSAGVEAQVRFGSVAARCRKARVLRRLSLKEAATGTRLPQYRVRAIETSRLHEVQLAALQRYVRFLGLQSWFKLWSRANPAVVKLLESQ
jgi:hypothetical protein